ncbi:hypothetical protein [Pseudomonas haemolytica]|uniref:Uncharacterized protein n=1 Tax=Pseudomonas haemolytica TaxID=2600065 RepID=A0A5P1DGH5_9PSED|nr:hypothetical protein [Pseudomonas haemolytica]MBJ2274298.1 hypothetical protein [Pseudomonas haemolytica]MBK3448803.1 hypothetical protein [Pseudomonas haemolytica]MBK3460022.1 hypothetical protein [Pseudomonas haemolytica]MRJ39426.1 hypothetical protein [Pseudomonas haemolytica]
MNRQLQYQGYTGSIEYSAEDNCLFGRLLYISALVSYEGQTEQALEAAFREAVNDVLKRERNEARQPNRR